MRLEDAGPRTRLLALMAGLATLAWVAAVAGVGTRVEPLPADAALLPALPGARDAPTPVLEPLTAYSVIAERPLFSTDRTPRPFFLSGAEGEPGTGGFDYELTSVLLTPSLRMAILQPAGGGEAVRVREGAAPPGSPGWRLVSLDRRSAVFDGPEGPVALALRVFDGAGALPPASRAASPVGVETGGAATDHAAIPVDGTGSPAVGEAPATGAAAAAATAVDVPRPDPARLDAIRERIQARRARQQRQEGQ